MVSPSGPGRPPGARRDGPCAFLLSSEVSGRAGPPSSVEIHTWAYEFLALADPPRAAQPVAHPAAGRTRIPSRSMPSATRGQDWRALLAIFWFTSMVEGLGVSQIFAFLPSYLREMGVPEPDRLQFVGLFGALIFI